MKLSEELQWRGFVHQTTFENIEGINDPRTFYLGVDPSSSSMQIGNLAAVMLVKHLVNHGHKAVVLVGGATGMIGDPKEDSERDLKSLDEITKNKAGISDQYKRILEGDDFEMVDNYDWFKNIGYLDFLRDVGKNFSMTQLLDRDFIKTRIGEDNAGISYAEFSYSLIQGYDFLHLYREKDVTLQIGGSDQWGNMLSGVPLIRKLEDTEAHVWTLPLVLNKVTGKKFGKSEGGAVWLDSNKTSVFDFYQFWLNVDDEGVGDYIKIYTPILPDEYSKLMEEFNANPANRAAQKYLAEQVTSLVHGQDRTETVKLLTEVLFGNRLFVELSEKEVKSLDQELPITKKSSLSEALIEVGLADSKSQARQFVDSGAIKINDETRQENKLEDSDYHHGFALVKRGKNKFALIKK